MKDGKIKIIIADDHKTYREGLGAVLEDFNIEISGNASNGNELLELLQRKFCDVVLLDLEMPGLDGSQTLDRLKLEFPEVRTIVISQYDEPEIIKNFFNRGACAYLTKNTGIEIIVKAINEVKEKGVFKENLAELFKRSHLGLRNKKYVELFTLKEMPVIQLLCNGKTVREISASLNIAEKTVEAHLTEIYKKANVNSRSQFLVYAVKKGLNFMN